MERYDWRRHAKAVKKGNPFSSDKPMQQIIAFFKDMLTTHLHALLFNLGVLILQIFMHQKKPFFLISNFKHD